AGVVFAPDGKTVAVICPTRVYFWDLATGKTGGKVKVGKSEGWMSSGVFTPDGKTLVVVRFPPTRVGTAEGWPIDVARQAVGEPLAHTVGFLTALAVSPDGKLFAVGAHHGDAEAKITLWDRKGQEAVVCQGHAGGVTAVAYAPDGGVLVSAGTDH